MPSDSALLRTLQRVAGRQACDLGETRSQTLGAVHLVRSMRSKTKDSRSATFRMNSTLLYAESY